MLDQLALYLISSSFNCFLSHSFPTGGHPTCYRIIPKVAPAYQGFPQEFYFICKHCLCCQVWRHRLPVFSGAADPFHWLHISLGAMTHARLIPYEIWSVVGELHCPCRDRHSSAFGMCCIPMLSTSHLCYAEAVSTCEHISLYVSWNKLLLSSLNIALFVNMGIKPANWKNPSCNSNCFHPPHQHTKIIRVLQIVYCFRRSTKKK